MFLCVSWYFSLTVFSIYIFFALYFSTLFDTLWRGSSLVIFVWSSRCFLCFLAYFSRVTSLTRLSEPCDVLLLSHGFLAVVSSANPELPGSTFTLADLLSLRMAARIVAPSLLLPPQFTLLLGRVCDDAFCCGEDDDGYRIFCLSICLVLSHHFPSQVTDS